MAACLLWLIRARTWRAIRAVAREKQGARLMGIDVERVYALSFGIGMACLGAAACFCCRRTTSIRRSAAASLVAFTIVVLGGMGSFAGALAGGLLIGVVESLGGLFLGDSLGQMGIFAIFILVLFPAGVVRGKHEHERQDACAILAFGLAVLAITGFTQSGVLLTFIMMSLTRRCCRRPGTSWAVTAASCPSAMLFFGVGAYAQALGQLSLGWNPWLALPCAIALGMAAGWPWAG